jgi:hypothetical protein
LTKITLDQIVNINKELSELPNDMSFKTQIKRFRLLELRGDAFSKLADLYINYKKAKLGDTGEQAQTENEPKDNQLKIMNQNFAKHAGLYRRFLAFG